MNGRPKTEGRRIGFHLSFIIEHLSFPPAVLEQPSPSRMTRDSLGRRNIALLQRSELVTSLSSPLWKVEQRGNQIRVDSHGGNRVTKITVTGDGPKPLVRRVLLPPPEKKK